MAVETAKVQVKHVFLKLVKQIGICFILYYVNERNKTVMKELKTIIARELDLSDDIYNLAVSHQRFRDQMLLRSLV